MAGGVVLSRRYGLEIRAAQQTDAAELIRLLGQAGVHATPQVMADRLAAMRDWRHGAVLVASGYGGLTGLVALDWAPTLSQSSLVARLSALLVDAAERRQGIGRLLLKSAAHAARAEGCAALEWSPGPAPAAEAFGAATGFVAQGSSFVRSLRRRSGEEAA